jgi:hypothetical protein
VNRPHIGALWNAPRALDERSGRLRSANIEPVVTVGASGCLNALPVFVVVDQLADEVLESMRLEVLEMDGAERLGDC